MENRLVLVDGHALVFRAYYAFPASLTDKQGKQVNAIYGFTSMLLTIIKEQHPEYLAVAFDMDKPTFRHLEFVGYKAQRPETDVELTEQLEKVREIVRTLNIPIFQVEGFEGDDVIGTLARQACELKSDLETVIVTGDKDALQLICDKVKVYVPARGKVPGKIYDEMAVEERFGFKPKQMIDWKALAGDASDNIKGVVGIGQKTAANLVKKYGSVEEIYKQIEHITGMAKQKLVDGYEEAMRSKKLVTIVTDVPITLDLAACKVSDYDNKKAAQLLTDLGFISLIKKLPKEAHEDCFSPRLFE